MGRHIRHAIAVLAGIVIGCTLGLWVVLSTLTSPLEECARVNNVFSCKCVTVPTTPEKS